MTARTLYSIAFALCLCLNLATKVGHAEDFQSLPERVQSLEHKYFHHDYASEQLNTRIARLERLVFGTVSSDAPESRVARLDSAAKPPPSALSSGLPSSYARHKPVPLSRPTSAGRPPSPAKTSPRIAQSAPPAVAPRDRNVPALSYGHEPRAAPNHRKQAAHSGSQARPKASTARRGQPANRNAYTAQRRPPANRNSYTAGRGTQTNRYGYTAHRRPPANRNSQTAGRGTQTNRYGYTANRGQQSNRSVYNQQDGSPEWDANSSYGNANEQYGNSGYNNQADDTGYGTTKKHHGLAHKITGFAGKVLGLGKKLLDAL